MPEKSLTVATYAAGASLAAITLIYVFAPTYFLDSDDPPRPAGLLGSGSRKNGIVGLSNPANDCFINSVLQVLAGLGDLRVYLIREMHRRNMDEEWVYAQPIPPDARESGSPGTKDLLKDFPEGKVKELQSGIVTKGLKDMLDALNERPIYRKTITAGPFVRVLELAFNQRISRQQQDAQEFLQVVAERLCDEYHAGCRARQFARRKAKGSVTSVNTGDQFPSDLLDSEASLHPFSHASRTGQLANESTSDISTNSETDGEEGFPMEGKFESQIECMTCGFKPRPTESTFCTLTLNVPQTSATTLNTCFDGMFKTEYIDDFKCEKCRLVHAISALRIEASRVDTDTSRTSAAENIAKLEAAIETDPENPPKDVRLPDMQHAPKRRIARHIRLTEFPKTLAIHLSRSIYDASHLSQKNLAKVAFPEMLPLGGLLRQRKYKLLGLVTHKGSHYSGHYETFRRQSLSFPYSNVNTFQPSGVYSRTGSPASTPRTAPTPSLGVAGQSGDSSPTTSLLDLRAGSSTDVRRASIGSSRTVLSSRRQIPTSEPRQSNEESGGLKSLAASARTTLNKLASRPSSRAGTPDGTRSGLFQLGSVNLDDSRPATLSHTGDEKVSANLSKPQRRKQYDRWWRISDDKVKEAKTREVLGMQREVYLLFYELEKSSS